MKLQVLTRLATPNDHALILSSWLHGAYQHCNEFSDMPRSLFFPVHHETLKRLVNTSKILCCVDAEDPTHVLAYLVFRNYNHFSVLHWVYTKQSFRSFGMAGHLLREAQLRPILFTSHETNDSQRFLLNKKLIPSYVPHLRHGEWHEDQFGVFLSSRQARFSND